MPSNPERRAQLADAGLAVLADAGARGLTHRAVDAAAGLPAGTASNYFRTRDALLGALGERIAERLSPDELVREPSPELLIDQVERLLGRPELALALFELRLESVRRPALAETLSRTLEQGFQLALADAAEARLLRFAIDGLVLDRLTAGDSARYDVAGVTRDLVRRLFAR